MGFYAPEDPVQCYCITRPFDDGPQILWEAASVAGHQISWKWHNKGEFVIITSDGDTGDVNGRVLVVRAQNVIRDVHAPFVQH